ncbi:MAG: P1 family peptidase [Acidobacteriota bacterium]
MDLPFDPRSIPPFPPVRHELSLPGFAIGHGTDPVGKTGATVILCPEGALAAAELRGSATGSRQLDSLTNLHHVASRAHAAVLAGGSGYGLDAASPVVQALEAEGRGFDTGLRRVPLVPTGILFDLSFGDPRAAPTAQLMQQALDDARGPREEGEAVAVATGSVGAGTGATVGKALGPERAMKGGLGFASFSVEGGPTVAAVVAVNAFGDVQDPASGKILAGCRLDPQGFELAGVERCLAAMPPDPTVWEGNTTLAVVLTDAQLDKVRLFKVCQMAFGGFYRSLSPALSLFDGDLVMTLSSQRVPAHVNQVGVLAQRAVTEAILNAVRSADGFGLLPTAADLSAASG